MAYGCGWISRYPAGSPLNQYSLPPPSWPWSGPIPEIRLVAAKCPSCGAAIEVPGNLETAHCVYCGAKILIARGSAKVPCKTCDGHGRVDVCKACNGTGKCSWYTHWPSSGNNSLPLGSSSRSECHDGVCSACGGKGQVSGLGVFGTCVYCGGTGRCPKCDGTGKCTQCRGAGFLSGPNASGRCGACGGTGLMDVRDYENPGPDRCPICHTKLPADWSFCSFCGHGKACPKCGKPWPKNSKTCPSCSYQRGARG